MISGTDHGSVTEDTTLLSTGQLTLTDPDAGQAAFQPATLTGQYGTLTLDATGKWSYALDNASAQVQALSGTDQRTETFTVSSVDGSQHTLTVQVNGTADSTTTGSGAVQEDGTLSDSGTLTTTTLGVRFVASQQSGSYGQFSVDASGAWHYTLDNTQPAVQALKTGDSQLETFTVALSDGSTTTVTITVTGRDDGAIISGTDHGSVTEDTTLLSTGQLTLTDSDAGQAAFQPATLTGQYGTLTLDATGKWSYALDNAGAQVQALSGTDQRTETFTVSSVDGSQHTLTVQVNGTADSTTTGSGAVQEDGTLSDSGTLTTTTLGVRFVASQQSGSYGQFSVDA
ncbi:VCBS domain-containing protein, partial [Chitinivorax tropicus]|uniref:VCBS domain-containing protein n=1 Tax=Chitinivorax tropicus TaxID=714531 RepID=UPI0031B5C73D